MRSPSERRELLAAPRLRVGDGPPAGLRLRPKKQRWCRKKGPKMPLKICSKSNDILGMYLSCHRAKMYSEKIGNNAL